MRRDDIDFRPPQARYDLWKIAKAAGYVLMAFIGSITAFDAGFWPGFAVVLAFIFGPKLFAHI